MQFVWSLRIILCIYFLCLVPVSSSCFRSCAPWLLPFFISSSCPRSAGSWPRRGSRTWQWQAASGIASFASVSCVSAGVGPLSAVRHVLHLIFLFFFCVNVHFYFPPRSPCTSSCNLSGIHQGKGIWNTKLVSMLPYRSTIVYTITSLSIYAGILQGFMCAA